MMATCSCPGRTGSACEFALRHAFTSRRLKRDAWLAVSSGTANSAAPGVPKSFVTLPIATINVS